MSKKNDSNNVVLYLLIAAIGISLVGTFMLYNETSITGYATTGTANLTIVTRTEINFTVDNINFGTGYVHSSCVSCEMDSEGNEEATCCVDFHGETDGFTIENIGNTNVSLNVSFAKDANTLLGGNAATNSYQLKASNGAFPGCTGNLGTIAYTEIATTSSYLVCDNMNFKVGTNEVDVDIKVVVPEDSKKGHLVDTITATATTV